MKFLALLVLPLTVGLARADNLPACTGTNFVTQETTQTNCVVIDPGGNQVVSSSYTNDPSYVNTPVAQTINDYQTTITGLLNGGTVYQQTFGLPFSALAVQNAIVLVDTMLAGDGAAYGGPALSSNSNALQSSVLSYVATSPTFDLPTLLSCDALAGGGTPFICSGVTVAYTTAFAVTFGPAAIAVGLGMTDELDLYGGQEGINVNQDYTYTVDQNAVTTNTYLTTQSYEIDGTTDALTTPEPGTFALIGCALAILALRCRASRVGALVAVAMCLARADNLPACTAALFVGQLEQSGCLVAATDAHSVITVSFLNEPTFVNTPLTDVVNDYQTTITAILNAGTTIYQQTFSAPFNAVAVQNAITIADALLSGDGAAFGAPVQTSNSTTLLSSATSYVLTSPTLDFPTLFGCNPAIGNYTETCDGVSVTSTYDTSSPIYTFGPTTIMTGAGNTDEYAIPAGQEDINVNDDYTYTVDQNAVTTNTYLTTQSYEIDGTTDALTTPEPGTFALIGCALAILALRCRASRAGALVAVAMCLARADNLPACTGTYLGAEQQQFNCLIAPIGGQSIVTASILNDPTLVNTLVNQVVTDYQTTITAILNGGTTVYQQTFSAPFNAVAVQNAIAIADALLSGDGATLGTPFQTSNSTTLLSSGTSYVPTSPTLDLPTLFACNIELGAAGSCNGVSVAYTEDISSAVSVFGPTTIMTGAGNTDEYMVLAGQEDINVNFDFTYVVDQNAITTNTYLTTQSYEIDGTTDALTTPEPGTFALIGCALAILALRCRASRVGALVAVAMCLARADNLPACTQSYQPNCVFPNPGGAIVLTSSYTNDPSFVNTPASQTVILYQTTLTAVLNGGATIYQQTFAAPFSDPSVQNAISQVDSLLALDGATFGSPFLTSNSTTPQSSVLTYVPTSPTLDLLTILNCNIAAGTTETCSGVSVTDTSSFTELYGPATIMIGPGLTEEFDVLEGQEDINVNQDYTYVVDQNAITTNTYLTTQSYEIDGTTDALTTPEPGTFALFACTLAILALRFRTKRRKVPVLR